MLLRKLLVANRGEIAVRIMRTAKRLGLATVAVHSEADAQAYHLRDADEIVAIGPSDARHSYLNIALIVEAARSHGVDAIHPGYGFLSENADFAAAVRAAGINFVGPPTAAIATMGNKTAARAAAVQAQMPVLPGTEALADLPQALAAAQGIGYPVLLKPAAGGGGIGMQRARDAAELERHFAACQQKASRVVGDGAGCLVKYLERARHVEVQLAADAHGNIVHLGERECSIQRRHQKVLEETPSPAVDNSLRQQMTCAAVRLARHVGYQSLGTVEMLVQDDAFYFLEMNTRLQVEHTVTEMVSGLDLVEWQLRIAMGEKLPASQPEIELRGHALQCRICAENPQKSFLPAPGTITSFEVPQGDGVRNDIGVASGDKVTPFYDPLIAKLVVFGPDRADAVARLRQALQAYRIEGVATNLPMHLRIVDDAHFLRGDTPTHFLREHLGYKGA